MKLPLILLVFCILQSNLILGQSLTPVSPETVGMSSERLVRLSQKLRDYVDKDQLAGCVALIARKGKVAYLESIGMQDIENQIPMQENSIFRIASQSKAIISVGVMILQEQGKLLISEPVGKHIPEFMETTVAELQPNGRYRVVPAKRPITIRDLLTHTAGISYGGGIARDQWEEADIQGWYFAHREEPILETVKKMAKLPFESHPGEKYVYGYNTDILGALVEVVSGQPLDEFLQEHILNPLGMDNTHFYLPPNKTGQFTVVYSSTEDGIEPAPNESKMVAQGAYVNGPRMSFSGGAGLLSTAPDYAKFLLMMLHGGEWNGQRVLSRKSVELMTVSHIQDEKFGSKDGVGMGLGFNILEHLGMRGRMGTVGEFGWGGAYHTTYWVDPQEELVVVYMTQLIPARGVDDHAKLRALVYQAIVD